MIHIAPLSRQNGIQLQNSISKSWRLGPSGSKLLSRYTINNQKGNSAAKTVSLPELQLKIATIRISKWIPPPEYSVCFSLPESYLEC